MLREVKIIVQETSPGAGKEREVSNGFEAKILMIKDLRLSNYCIISAMFLYKEPKEKLKNVLLQKIQTQALNEPKSC